MTKAQDTIGKHGQNIAASILSGLGIEMLQPVGTPIKAIPMGKIRGQDVYRVIWGEKVNGDHHGIIPGSGRYVLVETKTIMDRNLVWSDLREHQPGGLTQHYNFGGLSLLVWIHSTGQYIMEWPIVGFRPGKGITPEGGRVLDAVARGNIMEEIRLGMKRG